MKKYAIISCVFFYVQGMSLLEMAGSQAYQHIPNTTTFDYQPALILCIMYIIQFIVCKVVCSIDKDQYRLTFYDVFVSWNTIILCTLHSGSMAQFKSPIYRAWIRAAPSCRPLTLWKSCSLHTDSQTPYRLRRRDIDENCAMHDINDI